MKSTEVCKILNLARIRAFDFGIRGLISIFDDEHYSNSDYDILEPTVRADIRRALQNNSWEEKGSRCFKKGDLEIRFPAPSHTLGCNPADKVLESLGDKSVFCIVTPTQALLSSIALDEWNFEKAKSLVHHHPANLSKIWNWVVNESNDRVSRDEVADLKLVQKEGFELRQRGEQNLYPFKRNV